MDLHHGSNYEPFHADPQAIRESGPYFVRHMAEHTLKELYELYTTFGPYLSDEDIRDIAVEAHRRVMAELMGKLAEMREGWENDGTWWNAWEEPTGDDT